MKAILFIGDYNMATGMSIIIRSVCPEIGIIYATQYLCLTKERPMENIEYCLENNQLIENFWAEILSTNEATVIVSDLVLNHCDKLMISTSEACYRSYGNKLLFEPLSYRLKPVSSLGILFISKNTSLEHNWKEHLNGIDPDNVSIVFTTTEGMYNNPSRIGGMFKRLANLLE